MQFIKESKPYIEEIDRLKEVIYIKKAEKFEVGKGLKELKEEAALLRSRIDELKKSQDQA